MPGPEEERRSSDQPTIVAVSRDSPWLQFAEKTLRRTDSVKTLSDLSDADHQPRPAGGQTILMISSELVPAKIKDFQSVLDSGYAKIWVLKEPHDEHQRINDKHLKDLGIQVADRPDNSKAFRRLLKIIFG